MVKIALVDGRRVELELEVKSSDPREASRLFDKAAKAIQREWLNGTPDQPQHSGKRRKKRDLRWLKVTSYAVLSEVLHLEQHDVFETRIKEYRRYPRGQKGNPNLFQLGLMALFAERPDILNPRDRERLGKQFWQAHRHYVPPPFLLGFLGQLKRSDAGPMLDCGDLQREFVDWIIERRAMDTRGERGDYPLEIEDRVDEEEARRRAAASDDDSWADDEEG